MCMNDKLTKVNSKHSNNFTTTDNMTSLSPNVLDSILNLLEIVESKDWQTFEKVALSNPKFFRTLCKAIAGCEEFHGMTLLHAVVRHDPPLNIVAKIIDICPRLLNDTDCLGRTALHVAAGMGASSSLIYLIAHSCPSSCIAQDEDGKTPLHFACDSSCELFEDSSSSSLSRSSIPDHESIRDLLSVSIHAATMEDVDEMNPLEYAILSDSGLKTVKLLQNAAVKTQRSRSKSPVRKTCYNCAA